jgi:shikimate dehydrogenase
MVINANIKLCLVIGDPVAQSLSPAMHNAAYKAMGIESQYSFEAVQVPISGLKNFIEKAKTAVHFMAVTIPHKETIISFLDELDETAKAIGAVNTVLNKNGKLIGYNTDCFGAIESLKRQTTLQGRNVAILGSGGSARAIVYGLVNEKSKVVIYGRNTDKAQEIAKTFGCEYAAWKKRNDAATADIIINTTPIGKDGKELPIEENVIRKGQVVFDVNYGLNNTPLLNAAKSKNAVTVNGLDMLLNQGIMQFELYTGLKAPEEAMCKALQNKPDYAGTI